MKTKAYSYIRFSKPSQEAGDSLRRQTEYSEEIAKKLGLVLDDTLRLTDRGLSAFKGIHRTKGALGEFLKLVEENKIAVGSCLIIEALDRLSREELLETNHLMTGILLKGIDIYTAMDNKHFTKSTFTSADLIISAIKLEQGHEESEKKSIRIREAWVGKRENISNIKLTGRCPAWLTPVRKSISPTKNIITDFNVITERAKVINQIFDLKLSGMGLDLISVTLNKSSLWIPDSGWRKSYVRKILFSRAIIGEYQPCKLINGKRTPEGDVITGYFPAILEPEKFNRVQALLNESKALSGARGGRTGKISNLFSHLGKCGECNGPMAYLNKGNNWQYLQCDKARRKVNGGCNPKLLKYASVEETILSYCYELNLSDILPGSDQTQKELSFLSAKIQNIEGESIDLEKKINNLTDTIQLTDDHIVRERLVKIMSEQSNRIEALSKERNTIQASINVLQATASNSEKQISDIKELIVKMKTMEGEERIKLRINLRNQLRQLITEIRIFDINVFTIEFKSGVYRQILTNRSKTTISETEFNKADLID